MFSAPLSLHTDTAFELPADRHENGAGNAWIEAHLAERDAHSHLQGLAFDGQGGLWAADTPFGRIFRVGAGGEWELAARYDGWPGALRFHADGRLIIADARHGLLALDVTSRTLAPFLTHRHTQRFKGLSDLVFDTQGDLYFSDRGRTGLHDPAGAVFVLTASGSLRCLLEGIPGPAGLAMAPDHDGLLIAVAGDNSIWRLSLDDAGTAQRHIQLSGGNGPRALAIDHDGNLFVAHHGLGCVWQFNKRGEPKLRIDSARGDWTSGLALHPHHPNELFVSEARTGTVLKATLPLY